MEGELILTLSFRAILLKDPSLLLPRVLILPIQGEGRANITMHNIKVIVKATGKNVVSKGGSYFQADKVITNLEPGKMQMNLENLYRGDKRLGDSTNLFLNENWQDIYKELRPSVEDTFAQVLTGVINNFFAKNKYNTLFLEWGREENRNEANKMILTWPPGIIRLSSTRQSVANKLEDSAQELLKEI